MHALFLTAYVVLPLLTWWRSRSLAWTVIVTVASLSVAGVGVSFAVDHIAPMTWTVLQLVLLGALAIPVVLAFAWPPRSRAPRQRQLLAIGLPVVLLLVVFGLITLVWTPEPAFRLPVGFLMGRPTAEDNAEWLDFAALLATGDAIQQAVPLGGPLQLFLAGVATFMAVVSQMAFGGVNQVMVAANTVVYGQLALVALAPLALAPLAEARVPRRGERTRADSGVRVPVPLIWAGLLVLVPAVLIATTYGHLTWQFVAIVVTLWVATFIVDLPVPRGRLLTSLAVAAAMTVWVPLNVIAVFLLVGWATVIVLRGLRDRSWDLIGLGLVVVVFIGLGQPLRSSFAFIAATSASSGGFASGGVTAMGGSGIPIPTFLDSTLLAASGGVEQVGPLLAVLAIVGALGTAVLWDRTDRSLASYARFVPVGLLAGFALALQILDQWSTGTAPNYGSSKFAFLVAVTVASACVPMALMLLSPGVGRMTATRWVGVASVVILLLADSILIRSIAAVRPEQWTPPIPFENPQSYWWPAEVNGAADQPISGNPIGCVYLPAGAKAPSGILDSGLSDPQRVYACTRLLAGLAGEDSGAQPMVDWLRREWLSNERAWQGVYGYLADMPDEVLDRPVILLDDGSNVTGLESMRSLLERHPSDAWSQP